MTAMMAGQLKCLLFLALNEGTTYSALVPWVLDSDYKGLTLSEYAQQRQCLQQIQLPAGQVHPWDMQQYVLQVVAEVCQQATQVQNDQCPAAAGRTAERDVQPLASLTAQGAAASSTQQRRQHGTKTGQAANTRAVCGLSQPASRLAKLHGHLLAHLAAPNLVEQLQLLLLLLTAAPLGSSAAAHSSPGSTNSAKDSCGKPAGSRQAKHSAAQAASLSAEAVPALLDGHERLLPCRSCAAWYAAKALECCSKLLCCMPCEVLQALVSCPHLQHYSPALTAQLSKALTVGPDPSTPGSTTAGPPSSAQQVPWQQQFSVQPHGLHSAAGGGGDHGPTAATPAGRVGVAGWPSTPVSAGSGGGGGGLGRLTASHRSLQGVSSSDKAARAAGRTPASTSCLSGVGLLMPHNPSGPGLTARPASAGQLPAGGKAAKTAALCNREKSRDVFFSILRRASSTLDGLRLIQDDAMSAAGGCPQQVTAAAAAATSDLAELLAEVSVSAKQLLLQLAPSNLTYLAELFVACVLQSATTGETLLEPALVLMAEKDPGKFQKLQQRLADRPPGGASSPVVQASTPGSSGYVGKAGGPGSGPGQQGGRQGRQPPSRPQATKSTAQLGQHCNPPAGGAGLDGLQHVAHIRSAAHQQQPHVLATAGGAASAAGAGPNSYSSSSSSRCIAPKRHIVPQAHAPPGQQQQQQLLRGTLAHHGLVAADAGLNKGVAQSRRHVADSPLPPGAAVGGGAGSTHNSPLPASCLSPLFALASDSPLTAAAAVAATNAKAAAGCSPLVNNSSSRPQDAALSAATAGTEAAAAPAAAAAVSSGEGTQELSGGAVNTLGAAVQGSVGSRQQQGAATAAGKVKKVAALSGPHSAPPKLQAAAVNGSSSNGLGVSMPSAVLTQYVPGPALALLKLLQLTPPGQHVLLLLLHAADSSSFNRALLRVISTRVAKLLCSSPGSFTAASGLGRQASAIVALGTYCSYLCFAAGASELQPTAAATAATAAAPASGGAPEGFNCSTLLEAATPDAYLQQQPLLDVSALLQAVLAGFAGRSNSSDDVQQHGSSNSSSHELDCAWRLALAVPFMAAVMQLAPLNLSAAASPNMQAAAQLLQAVKQLPALIPTAAGFGPLPVCVGCCIQSWQGLQPLGQQCSQQPPLCGGGCSSPVVGIITSDQLSTALASGSCLVDSSYWSICCPGLLQLGDLLREASRAAAAATTTDTPGPDRRGTSATRTQQQQQQFKPPDGALDRKHQSSAVTADTGRGLEGGSAAAQPQDMPSQQGRAAAPAGNSPAGVSTRHTTPLLLAPRGVLVVPEPPAVLTTALAAVAQPLRQQLQAAFINQYSTDDNPVKMRDVLTVVNGILLANSLSVGLSQGVPAVLQAHMELLQQAVQQQLAPGAGGATGCSTQLQGQVLARAVHDLYSQQLQSALPQALECAMKAAADHAQQASAAACAALLPADVPPAAAATAAALVTATCQAGCAQRLLQEVPVLVQSTLADAADDLVRLMQRQWAVHERMTAAGAGQQGPGASPGAATAAHTHSQAAKATSSSTPVTRQPARLQPVRLEEAGPSASRHTTTAAPGTSAAAAAPTPEASVQRGTDAAQGGTARSIRRVQAVPTGAADAADASGSAGEQVPQAGGALLVKQRPDRCDSGGTKGPPPPCAQPEAACSAGMGSVVAVCQQPAGPSASAHTRTDEHAQPVTDTAAPAAKGASVAGSGGAGLTTQSHAANTAAAAAATSCDAESGADLTADHTAPAADTPAAVIASLLAAATSQLCLLGVSDRLQQEQAVVQVTAAAQLAGHQLVSGVTCGKFNPVEVEQQLLWALQQAQAAAEDAVSASSNSSATEASSAPHPLQDQQLARQQHHVVALLCGAVVHSWMTSQLIKADVWQSTCCSHAAVDQQLQGSSCSQTQPPNQHQQCEHQQGTPGYVCASGAGGVPPHLTQLPVMLMKAARADVPVWLLRQLRQWLQASTLGYC